MNTSQIRRSPTLSPRLMAVAQCVRQGSVVADVGTDHAYLPVWAVTEGRSPFAVASDIREGPAKRAAITIERYGVSDRVRVVVAPGLSGVDLSEVDDVVITGMGGETILSILEAAPPVKYLVLQPQTDLPAVRRYLAGKGYRFEEVAVTEASKVYNIFKAHYTGAPYELSEYDARIGNPQGETSAYLKKLRAAAKKQLAGLKAAAQKDESAIEDINKTTLLLGGCNDDNT
ncbi:MAG TPA: class I SAM-dependent methyltransferase [Terriglobales bacterium]|nr:class I SAM-dependent methyltransferase [Terriglobales bacterium]